MSTTPPVLKPINSIPASQTEAGAVTDEQYAAVVAAVATALGLTLDPAKVTSLALIATPQSKILRIASNV